VDRPEVLGLSVHDAGEASGEQLRAAQTNLELQALGVAQAGRGGTLRGGGLGARGQERGAVQKLAVREQSGAVFGLGAHSLRKEWRGSRPGGGSGRLRRSRGGGVSGDRGRSHSHRPGSGGVPTRTGERFSEVANRGSRFQYKASSGRVGSLVAPPDVVISGLAGFRLGATPHVNVDGSRCNCRSDDGDRELVQLNRRNAGNSAAGQTGCRARPTEKYESATGIRAGDRPPETAGARSRADCGYKQVDVTVEQLAEFSFDQSRGLTARR
jgi:hypothetical protein